MGEQEIGTVKEGERWKQILSHPVTWGVVFTILLCLFAVFLGRIEHCFHEGGCISNFEILLDATPNEVGDTLAGFAGALAFVWIIVTVWLQSNELALTRQELTEQRAATQDMARSMSAQAKIFENEQRYREEAQAQLLLEEHLRTFILEIKRPDEGAPYWVFSNEPIDPEWGGMGETFSYSLADYIDDRNTIDAAIELFRVRLQSVRDTLWEVLHQTTNCVLPEKSDYFSKLIARVDRILEMKGNLSLPQQERLSRLRLEQIVEHLNTLQETSELWKA